MAHEISLRATGVFNSSCYVDIGSHVSFTPNGVARLNLSWDAFGFLDQVSPVISLHSGYV